jgi:hypothetical protein
LLGFHSEEPPEELSVIYYTLALVPDLSETGKVPYGTYIEGNVVYQELGRTKAFVLSKRTAYDKASNEISTAGSSWSLNWLSLFDPDCLRAT